MYTPRAFWRFSLGMIGLVLLLTACTGGSGGSTTTSTPTPSPIPIPSQSTLSFTASGGLTGSYAISDPGTGSSDSSQALGVIVGDQNWYFTLSYRPYPGPGTYSFSNTPTDSSWGSVGFASNDGTKVWQLLSPATCQLTVTADTAFKTGGSSPKYHEVKGTFACSSLASTTESPLAVSNGQFDIVALVVS